ncbi:ABC transporter permease, partial [Brachyspira hampsonii]|nr:ABC transporter permease [Brachyspira hampsonii]
DLYIPYIKPYIFTGISQSMGITWKSILAAEILALPAFGIGTKLYESHLYLDSVSLFAYCLIAIIFNAVFEIIIRINHDK